jgi:nucleoside-diphosphate-sugar epimerase
MTSTAPEHLVIFGCGYVGTAVAVEGVARGLRVTALTRNEETAATLRGLGLEVVVADLATESWHEAIRGRADYVLNSVSSGGAGLDGYRRSYVEGMRSIATWARRTGGIGTLVYTSSTSVYPQGGGATIDEAASAVTPNSTDRAGLLVTAEDLVREVGAGAERWFVLRLAGIYGPGRHHFMDQVRRGSSPGTGEAHLNLVYRDDIASAVWSCFDAPSGVGNEVFNVVDDQPTRKREIAGWLAARLGVGPTHFTGEPISERRGLTPDRVISNHKLKRVLGWAPGYPSYREGCASLLSR